jgi:predicted transcriptional regulator
MSTPKEQVRDLLNRLPDNVSVEDIQYHLYVLQKIENGLKEVEEGGTITQEEAERRLAKWLRP